MNKFRSMLLPGRPLLGFAELFDQAWGRPPRGEMPTVTPSKVGPILLPFPCPHCSKVCPEMVHPVKRKGYKDPARGFSFCPSCGGRYVVNTEGVPLSAPLPPGASHGPARVEREGKVEVVDGPAAKEAEGLMGLVAIG